jgi:hypothetical protein
MVNQRLKWTAVDPPIDIQLVWDDMVAVPRAKNSIPDYLASMIRPSPAPISSIYIYTIYIIGHLTEKLGSVIWPAHRIRAPCITKGSGGGHTQDPWPGTI